jgi:hypothetical protein
VAERAASAGEVDDGEARSASRQEQAPGGAQPLRQFAERGVVQESYGGPTVELRHDLLQEGKRLAHGVEAVGKMPRTGEPSIDLMGRLKLLFGHRQVTKLPIRLGAGRCQERHASQLAEQPRKPVEQRLQGETLADQSLVEREPRVLLPAWKPNRRRPHFREAGCWRSTQARMVRSESMASSAMEMPETKPCPASAFSNDM